jgi:hypothetical protein
MRDRGPSCGCSDASDKGWDEAHKVGDMTDKWMVSGWDWMVVDLGRSIMLGHWTVHEPQMCFLALEKQSILSPITGHKQRQNHVFGGIKKS